MHQIVYAHVYRSDTPYYVVYYCPVTLIPRIVECRLGLMWCNSTLFALRVSTRL